MLMLDLLPHDVLIELLLYCDNGTLDCIKMLFGHSKWYYVIRKKMLQRVQESLKPYRNAHDFKVHDQPDKKKECKLCECTIYEYPYAEIFSGYQSMNGWHQDFSKHNALSALQKKIKRPVIEYVPQPPSPSKEDGLYVFTFAIKPEEYQPSGGSYTMYNICWHCAILALDPKFKVHDSSRNNSFIMC
jgi:hypothetical protein